MLIDWIRREPVAFSDFIKLLLAVLLIYATEYGMKPDAAAAVALAVGAGLAWFTRAAVVPNVKLPEATVAEAKTMTQADINEVRP